MDYFRKKQEKGGNLSIPTRKVYLFSESAWNLLLPYSFYKSLGIHSCVPNINNVYDVFCCKTQSERFLNIPAARLLHSLPKLP